MYAIVPSPRIFISKMVSIKRNKAIRGEKKVGRTIEG
jgi:hypothetical protein